MYTRKFFVFFVLFATGVVSTQINIFEWLEFKLNKNTSMLKEVLGILRKGNFIFFGQSLKLYQILYDSSINGHVLCKRGRDVRCSYIH